MRLAKEVETINWVRRSHEDLNVPEILDSGSVIMDEKPPKLMGFYLMPRYEIEFGRYVKKLSGISKIDTILKLVIETIEILKVIHDSGKVHNDVKPSNIMITNG